MFQVFYTSLDHVRIAAWYCRPDAAGPERTPAIMLLPGYQMDPPIPKEWARKGYVALSVAPRGKLRSNDRFNPGYPGLLTHNLVDRNTYGYRGFYLDAIRAVDWLLTRPELDDSTRIGVTGSSQGGALTVVVAAMRLARSPVRRPARHTSAGYMDATWLTHSYPYQEINDYLRLYPERREQARSRTLQYFDITNFADRITCPIAIFNIGEC